MRHKSSTEPRNRELILRGELVLQRIAGLKDEIQAALEGVDHLFLNVSGAEAFDLPFLQLLCSGHRSAVQVNKSLTLTGKLPEAFHRQLEEAGFVRHIGCSLDCQNSCIWMGRRNNSDARWSSPAQPS